MHAKSKFHVIRDMYPEHRAAFDLLLLSDEDFRTACQDYEECLRALEDPRMNRYTTNWRVISQKIRNEIHERLLQFSPVMMEDFEETSSTIS